MKWVRLAISLTHSSLFQGCRKSIHRLPPLPAFSLGGWKCRTFIYFRLSVFWTDYNLHGLWREIVQRWCPDSTTNNFGRHIDVLTSYCNMGETHIPNLSEKGNGRTMYPCTVYQFMHNSHERLPNIWLSKHQDILKIIFNYKINCYFLKCSKFN